MFSFLRRYERPVVFLVFSIVAASFLLPSVVSRTIGNYDANSIAVGKKKYRADHFHGLKRVVGAIGSFGVVLNDNLLGKSFVENGLADRIYYHIMKEIEPHLRRKMVHEKMWQPFKHKNISSLAVDKFWQEFSPNLPKDWNSFKSFIEKDNVDDFKKLFSLKCALYNSQFMLRHEELKLMFLTKEDRLGDSWKDPDLGAADFSLFGYSDAENWFGREFIEAVVRVILLGSQKARLNGIVVTDEEVRADILSRAVDLSRCMNEFGVAKLSPQVIYSSVIHSFGFSEDQFIDLWRDVLMFRKFLASGTKPLLIDPLPFVLFSEFANDGCIVDNYSIDQNLFIENLDDLKRFELYGSCVDSNWRYHDSILINESVFDRVRAVAPSLTSFLCKAKFKIFDEERIKEVINLKKLWDWQVDNENWKFVVGMFPYLDVETEDRLSLILNMPEQERSNLYKICRNEMVRSNSSIVEDSLRITDDDIAVDVDIGTCLPYFPFDIQDTSRFVNLVVRAVEGDESARKKLLFYNDGTGTCISFMPVEISDRRILTFSEAKYYGAANELISNAIASFNKINKIENDGNGDAFWKDWFGGKIPNKSEEYNKRSLNFLSYLFSKVTNGEDIDKFLNPSDKNRFEKQWLVKKERNELSRKNGDVLSWDLFISKDDDKWVRPSVDEKRFLGFRHIVEDSIGDVVSVGLRSSAWDVCKFVYSSMQKEFAARWLDYEIDNNGFLLLIEEEE